MHLFAFSDGDERYDRRDDEPGERPGRSSPLRAVGLSTATHPFPELYARLRFALILMARVSRCRPGPRTGLLLRGARGGESCYMLARRRRRVIRQGRGTFESSMLSSVGRDRRGNALGPRRVVGDVDSAQTRRAPQLLALAPEVGVQP